MGSGEKGATTPDRGFSLVSYYDNGVADAGIARDGAIVSLATLGCAQRTVRELLSAGPSVMHDVLELAQTRFDAGGEVIGRDSVQLRPPIPDPGKILCLGLNYADHAEETNIDVKDAPPIFAKFANSLVGPCDPIVMPRVSHEIDYEGELAVVIGRVCKDAAAEDALSYVAGYSVFNDVTARDLQMTTSQWTAGKALDTFGPLGPGIVLSASVPDPQALELTTRVNGDVVQSASTANMIFPIASTIAYISSLMTLSPGDIIATGTPGGVGFSRVPPQYLRSGDVVEVLIDGLGTLSNPVVEAPLAVAA